jgi:small subunit ribosomal protein S15
MATLYGRGRGKAGSHAPKAEKPYWLKLKEKDIEELIVDMAKQGFSSAKIGLVLRDTYGIPNTKIMIGKKIQQLLKEKGIKTEHEEKIRLEKKHEKLKSHFERNKGDKTAKRGLQLTESKLARFKRYYAHKKR